MRALLWYGPGDVRLEERPVPRLGPDEVLVAVERVGICGTDLEEYLHGPVGIPTAATRTGVTLGHEVVGRVVLEPVALSAVPRAVLGERVIPDVVRGCGVCWWCARHEEHLCPTLAVLGLQVDGGLADYLVARRDTCLAVPPDVHVDVAAFAEPTAVAIRALRKAPELTGAVVVVTGAGAIGCLVAQLAHASGADVVTVEPDGYRRGIAAGFGAIAVDPSGAADAVRGATGGRGADVVVECAGRASAVRGATELVRPGGTIVLVGTGDHEIPLPVRRLIHQEVVVRDSVAHLWDVDVAPALAALASGAVDVRPLLTDVVPLEHAVAGGFERLRHDTRALKILVACR